MQTCKHCNNRIEFNDSNWPPDTSNNWEHVQGEGVRDRPCFGMATNAEPVRDRELQKTFNKLVDEVLPYDYCREFEKFAKRVNLDYKYAIKEGDLPIAEGDNHEQHSKTN